MVQPPEQYRQHRQSLVKARQLFEITQVRSQSLAEYFLVGIQKPMGLELAIQADKQDLAIMEM
jgi:hypothetical protein